MLNIKWDNGVTGYLSESEKELCGRIDREISAINVRIHKLGIPTVVFYSIMKQNKKCLMNYQKIIFLA